MAETAEGYTNMADRGARGRGIGPMYVRMYVCAYVCVRGGYLDFSVKTLLAQSQSQTFSYLWLSVRKFLRTCILLVSLKIHPRFRNSWIRP